MRRVYRFLATFFDSASEKYQMARLLYLLGLFRLQGVISRHGWREQRMPACLAPGPIGRICKQCCYIYAKKSRCVLTSENGPYTLTLAVQTRECPHAGLPSPSPLKPIPQPGRWTMRVSPPFQLATRSSEMMLTWLPDVPTKCIPRLRMA